MSEKPRDRQSASDRIPSRSTQGGRNRDERSSKWPQPIGDISPEDSGLERLEAGSERGSQRHPPHVTGNEEGAPVQNDSDSSEDIPVLPANASGRDAVSTGEQNEPIDDESMYDRRPERDKDRPPSDRVKK